MKRLAIILIGVMCFSCVAVLGQIVEIELPGLLGHYSDMLYARIDTFLYVGASALIWNASIRLNGSATSGLAECCITELHCPDSVDWYMELSTTLSKQGAPGYCVAETPNILENAFDFKAPFSNAVNGGFDTIQNGDRLDIHLWFFPMALITLCRGITPPEGDVTEVVLVLDLDTALMEKPKTWGGTKALYADD